ncbi:MAG: rhodanese-like domain-containing protein [Clostridia bacterium]|nr:rhodanese-like domain-containing protein [Clostridia bacterium]
MKKILFAMTIVLGMALLFTGCGSEDAEQKNSENIASETENAAPEKDDEAEKAAPEVKEEVKPEPIVEGSGTYEEITQEEAKEIMDDKEEPAVVLDVRSFDEFNAGHIDGAICFPLESINDETRAVIEQFIPRKDQTILVYDNDPERSKKGAQLMADIGYLNVKEFGQLDDWDYGTVEE